jgi:tryptophan-rich sensory protein
MSFRSFGDDSSDHQYYSDLYKPDWSMALAILASLINLVFVTPISYSITWYERYGSDHRRTLLNQLVSSICWNIVISNLTSLPLEIFLTIFGPLGGCHETTMLHTLRQFPRN